MERRSRLSTLGHWGWLLPTSKYPAGALQVTKTYLGSHKASTALLPPLPLQSSRSTYRTSRPCASSRRLRSMQSGHELMRPCPQRDVSFQEALHVPVLWVAWLGIPEPHGMNSSPRNTRGCRTFKTQLGDTSCHLHLRLCTKVDRWILVLPGQRACIPHHVGALHRLRGQKRPSDFIFKSVPHEELRRLEGAAGS